MPEEIPVEPKVFLYEMGREEPLSKLSWWISLRWILLGVAIAGTFIGGHLIRLEFPTTRILLVCVPVALLNALLNYQLFPLKKAPSLDLKLVDRITYVQFGTDLIYIAALFHYTGGIASPFLFYFLFHVILTGVLLERWACFLYVTLFAITISTLALAEFLGFISHLHKSSFISDQVQNNPAFVLMLIFFFLIVLYISTFFASTLLKRLRERIAQLTGLEEKLADANERLEILNKVARDTASTFGLYPRLDFMCGSIRYLMEVKGAAIRLLDERTNRLELVSACGLSEEYIKKGPVDADKSMARALQGEPHLIVDVSSDPSSIQYPEQALKEGIVSMLSFPLKGREKVIGTLRLYSSERRQFSEAEMDFLSALASQGAISIENAKIYDALKRQDEAKNDFIMLTTHELKAPLTAIQGFLDIMSKGYVGAITEKQKELIQRMQKRIEAVLEVSTELLDIYRWQSKVAGKEWSPISLKEQIRKADDLFRVTAQKKELTIVYQLPDDDVILRTTEEEVEKILNNLINNAIKYTPTGGTITVALSATQNRISLRVKDTGIGISSEDLPKIFNEFFRTKEAKLLDPDGSGLGLPFVKRIVESLGGTISAVSEEGKGTEFVVTFVQT